jgi:hypothetical protein
VGKWRKNPRKRGKRNRKNQSLYNKFLHSNAGVHSRIFLQKCDYMSSNDKLLLNTDKDLFHPGDVVKGRVLVLLRRPLRGTGLTVDFYGEKKEKTPDGAYTKRFSSLTAHICEEKVFQDGEEHSFSLTLTDDLPIESSKGFLGLFKSGPKYFLHATLVLSGGGTFDCKKPLKIVKKL